MKKTTIILGLILGIISCTQTKYFVKSEKELSQVNWEHNVLNYIPITENDLESSSILDTTYNLIVSKKFTKLNNYFSSIQSKSADFYLAKTLYHISKNEYLDASVEIKKIEKNKYELIKDLLVIDLSYELAKLKGLKDFKKFLEDYQALIDKYPNNKSLRNIVALRTRYIRYNY